MNGEREGTETGGRAATRARRTGGRRRPLVLAAIACAALGGCASAEKRACESGDWQGIGFADGSRGLGFERVGQLSDRCSDYDISVDSAAWAEGHAEGLEEYCEPTRGYDLGAAAGEYTGNCPAALKGRYLASYVRGLEIRRDELQLDYDRLRGDLDDARRDRAALDPEKDGDDLDDRIDDLEEDVENSLAARRDMNERIGRWSRQL